MSRTYIWPVSGMHCASCERIVTDALKTIPGVEEVEASLSKKKAGLRLKDGAPEPDLALINKRLQATGHYIGERVAAACEVEPVQPLSRRIVRAFLAVLLAGLAIRLLYVPFSRLVPSVSAGASVVGLLALGLVASVSTCLASTGAFLLAYTAESSSRALALRIQAGRFLSFIIGGAILGAIGGSLPTGSLGYGIIGLALGLGFVLVGLHLLGLTPSLASLGVRLPRALGRLSDKALARRDGTAPFVVGAATFLLPCGFTQTAQAMALASGSALQGAFLMGAFALGTFPVLFGITAFGSSIKLGHPSFRLAAGALLFFFAIGQLDGGLTVLGSPLTFGGAADRLASLVQSSVTAAPVNAQEQLVSMTVAYGAFSPSRFTVKRGVPVRWEVNGVDISGCASSIIAPKLGIRQNLTPGLNVIQFTPKETGVIPFSCSMGMIRGSFNVVE